jgi:hypothetical protein
VLTWIKSPVPVVVATQLLFTTGDLIARANMRNSPFALSTFLNWWFLVYFLIRRVAAASTGLPMARRKQC